MKERKKERKRESEEEDEEEGGGGIDLIRSEVPAKLFLYECRMRRKKCRRGRRHQKEDKGPLVRRERLFGFRTGLETIVLLLFHASKLLSVPAKIFWKSS